MKSQHFLWMLIRFDKLLLAQCMKKNEI